MCRHLQQNQYLTYDVIWIPHHHVHMKVGLYVPHYLMEVFIQNDTTFWYVILLILQRIMIRNTATSLDISTEALNLIQKLYSLKSRRFLFVINYRQTHSCIILCKCTSIVTMLNGSVLINPVFLKLQCSFRKFLPFLRTNF